VRKKAETQKEVVKLNKKKILLFLSIAIGLLLALSFIINFWYIPFKGTSIPEFAEEPDFEQILTPQELQADLDQLKHDLTAVHPNTSQGLPQQLEEGFTAAQDEANGEMTVGDFSIMASKLVCMLGDAHTSVSLGLADSLLPADIKVIEGRLYALAGMNLNPGDEILALGGVTTAEILDFAQQVIPAENPYWRQYRLSSILTKAAFNQMGAKMDGNDIVAEIKRSGEASSVTLTFGQSFSRPVPGDKKQFVLGDDTSYGYYLDTENSVCHFKLSTCQYTQDYLDFLKAMFEEIQDKGIENMVVDIRGNPGGHSGVVDEFLRYIDTDTYKSYGCTRRMSKAAAEQRGYIVSWGQFTNKPNQWKTSKATEQLFSGDIYALVDGGTFSSGNWFGVILQDNNIGTIVGEPTGNAPNSYGDVLLFQMENSKLRYAISYTQWVRPDETRAEDIALYPDYPVNYTIDDYVQGRDLAMEEVMRLIREGQ